MVICSSGLAHRCLRPLYLVSKDSEIGLNHTCNKATIGETQHVTCAMGTVPSFAADSTDPCTQLQQAAPWQHLTGHFNFFFFSAVLIGQYGEWQRTYGSQCLLLGPWQMCDSCQECNLTGHASLALRGLAGCASANLPRSTEPRSPRMRREHRCPLVTPAHLLQTQ